MILLPQKVAYRGTISGLRISSVDGTAFLDACAALVPYADGSHLVEIYDASGRMLRGYLSAAGTGETLTNVTAGWDFTDGWSFISGTGTVDDADSFSSTSGEAVIQKILLGQGALYKSKYSASTACTNLSLRSGSTVVLTLNDNTYAYATARLADAAASRLRFYTAGLGTTDVSVLEVNKVLTPSALGLTLTSTPGGATQKFAYKDASFTYNEASYYCLIKRAR